MCPRVLVGLLLFSLSPLFSIGVEEINLNYLNEIIQVIHTRYSLGQSFYDHILQFAVAINVPAGQCRSPIDQNFLSGEDTEKVKSDLNKNNLYQGKHLIAATPRCKPNIHSECALLRSDNKSEAVSPMKNLLNNDTNGCVVFYTYNSPCLDLCLNQKRDDDIRKMAEKMKAKHKSVPAAVERCILKSLGMLTEHQGPKAFVFKQVYRVDLNVTVKHKLATGLKKVAEKVPLYKCSNFCVNCLSGNQIINECLT